jgi:serine/threonine protein kinase
MDLPETIGPYRILELLGAGSAGVVYRAERGEGGPQAAVKTVRLPREAMVDSLRREIHALARLRHPGIVRILDEGLHEGVPWYAMELVEGGRTLRARLSEGPLPLSAALSLARRLCTPLAFLHGEGLVHRDLKPENVLVRARDGAQARDVGRPVLMDFGVSARFIGQSGRETLQIGEGLTGTVAYMAPEQIRGEPVDARADLYSLGCVLYELVTHQVPFHGKTLAQLVRQHMGEEPVAPSQRVAGIDPRLDELVLRLLAKSPRDRYGHAGAVADALAGLGAESIDGDRESKPRSYLYRPGFAGRDRPLHIMTELVARLENGAGGVVSISGESGVGKTRLLIELARQTAKLGIQVFSGQSEAISSVGTSMQDSKRRCAPPVEARAAEHRGSLPRAGERRD